MYLKLKRVSWVSADDCSALPNRSHAAWFSLWPWQSVIVTLLVSQRQHMLWSVQTRPHLAPRLRLVTGLPEPRKDHAVAMARFARDCLKVSSLAARNCRQQSADVLTTFLARMTSA